ncbi:MAG: phasin family protein [Gammaproteobacteria bacterium]|nr:phasin family protein [Gammaproteobacteria bacterium]
MKKFDFASASAEFLAPVQSLNTLAIATMEKAVDLQLALARKYADVVLESAKAANAVKDVDGAKSFADAQAEVVRKTVEDVVTDSKAFVELGTEYSNEVQAILKASAEKVGKLAA